jgi:exopolysaccharide production protein ExoQ
VDSPLGPDIGYGDSALIVGPWRMTQTASSPAGVQRAWSERIEAVLAGIAVLMLTSPGLLLLGVSDDPAAPENPAFRIYWLAPYAIILGLAAWRTPRLLRSWTPLLLAAAVVGWAYATKSWSIDAETTGRRVVALAVTTLFGLYLGAALDYRRFVQLIAGCFLILTIGSLVVALAMPTFGVDHQNNGGDWRGLWAEKNTLALFMALGGVAALSAFFLAPRSRWLWALMLALCALLLVMSRGKTALLCFVVTLVAAGGLWLMRRGRIIGVLTAWTMVTAGALIGFVVWLAPEVALKAVGKDPTLTGRTQIWKSVMDQVALHPLLGYGFAAFWGQTSVPAMIVRKQTGWTVPTAHNGWIDLLVQVGWIGVGLFAAIFLINILANIVRSAKTNEYFAILFLTIFGIFSLTESFLEQHNSLFWTLFVAVLTHALGPARRLTGISPAGTPVAGYAPG